MRRMHLDRQFRGIITRKRRSLRPRPGEGDRIMVLMSDSYLSARMPRLSCLESLQVYNSLPCLLTHFLVHYNVSFLHSNKDSLRSSALAILITILSAESTPNLKHIVSSTNRSTVNTLNLSSSNILASSADGSMVPFLTRFGYRSVYEARMISRGFLSVSCSFEDTYRQDRETSCLLAQPRRVDILYN